MKYSLKFASTMLLGLTFLLSLLISNASGQESQFNQACDQTPECVGNLECLTNQNPDNTEKRCGCPPGQFLQSADNCRNLLQSDRECQGNYEYSDHFSQCVDHATCSNVTGLPYWTCECDNGYSPLQSGHCAATFLTTCTDTTDCNSDQFLTCQAGICACLDGQIFSREQCLNIRSIGEECIYTRECVESSTCDVNSWKCSCPTGSSPSGDNSTCLWNYYRPCSLGDEYDPVRRCNDQQFLECSSSAICECQKSPDIVYSGEADIPCVAMPGSPCYESYQNRTLNCYRYSTCSDIGGDGRGVCKCDEGYSLDEKYGLCLSNSNSSNFIKSDVISWVWILLMSYCYL